MVLGNEFVKGDICRFCDVNFSYYHMFLFVLFKLEFVIPITNISPGKAFHTLSLISAL